MSIRLDSWIGIPSWPEGMNLTANPPRMLLLSKALQIPIMEEEKTLNLYSRQTNVPWSIHLVHLCGKENFPGENVEYTGSLSHGILILIKYGYNFFN